MNPQIVRSPGFLVTLLVILVLTLNSCGDSVSSSSAPFADMERQTHDLVNQFRASQGLPAMAYSETVAAQARAHSRDMSGGNLNHDGFQGRVDAIATSVSVASAGENVALNQGFADPAQQAVTGWINSPPHKANMVADFDITGIGIDKKADGTFYFTQLFIKSN